MIHAQTSNTEQQQTSDEIIDFKALESLPDDQLAAAIDRELVRMLNSDGRVKHTAGILLLSATIGQHETTDIAKILGLPRAFVKEIGDRALDKLGKLTPKRWSRKGSYAQFLFDVLVAAGLGEIDYDPDLAFVRSKRGEWTNWH